MKQFQKASTFGLI